VEAATLVSELKRRRVIRALIGYGIAAFAVLQIIEPVMHGLHWPDEVLSYVVVALAAGFPVVVSLAWIFDVNAGRIERSASSPAGPTGLRLGLLLVGIGVLGAAPGVVWFFVVRGHARPVPSTGAEARIPSIAVLPFADMSPAHDQEYFSDGVAEEIINALAHVENLRVIGRTSSFSFKGKNEDLRTIGQKLNVSSLLEGSVRKSADRIRITTELISASDGSHVWSETYDRKVTDIFTVQDQIANAVVEALKVKLVPGKGAPGNEGRTGNPEAYKHLLLGRHFQHRVSKEGTRLAEAEFRKAIALDPDYALAYTWLSSALIDEDLVDSGLTPEASDALNRAAMDMADRAVALAPGLSSAYSMRGIARTMAWDWEGARTDLARAQDLNPSDADSLRRSGILLGCLGRRQEAIAVLLRSLDLDPLLPTTWVWLGTVYAAEGKLALARSATERALAISPDFENARANLAGYLVLEGKPATALEAARRLPDENARLGIIAQAEYDLGHDAESRNALRELASRIGQTHPGVIAELHDWRGDRDAAFEWLDKAVQRHDNGLFTIKLDVTRNLHRDPRWPALLKRMNLPPE